MKCLKRHQSPKDRDLKTTNLYENLQFNKQNKNIFEKNIQKSKFNKFMNKLKNISIIDENYEIIINLLLIDLELQTFSLLEITPNSKIAIITVLIVINITQEL